MYKRLKINRYNTISIFCLTITNFFANKYLLFLVASLLDGFALSSSWRSLYTIPTSTESRFKKKKLLNPLFYKLRQKRSLHILFEWRLKMRWEKYFTCYYLISVFFLFSLETFLKQLRVRVYMVSANYHGNLIRLLSLSYLKWGSAYTALAMETGVNARLVSHAGLRISFLREQIIS